MKKLIGSIIIMLILAQPVSAECVNDFETVSIHIFQEYENYQTLDMYEKFLLKEEETETIEDLSYNMNTITNLLKLKAEVVSEVKTAMNEKSKNRQIMTEEQINKFQEFSKLTQEKNYKIKSLLEDIEANKNLKTIQEIILDDNIDYIKLSKEIKRIKEQQELLMDDLSNIIYAGNTLLDLL